ncbi:LacI family DNA-binding transcriptional regulator [Anaerotignum lactatifermentans]|uniref:LacI family DNA-binding transcriptional regulator n=1 Tax=Anaerotignum lactatifermentans TaxID=160404 RepID=UPI003AB5E19D
MAVTLQQIAELAGVSRGTVDRALHNRGRVNSEVALRIRKIADELGYVYHLDVHGNRGKNLKLGVVIPSIETATMQIVAKGARAAAEKLSAFGAEVIIREQEQMDGYRQLACIDELMRAGIHGLAISPTSDPEVCKKVDELENRGIPVIIFNGDLLESKRLCYVGMDNARGGRAAAGLMHLMLPDGGKVLPITAHLTQYAHKLRYTSFLEEMVKIAPNIELLPLQTCFNRDDFAYEITLHALERHPDLKGVYVAANGQHGVCEALRKEGLEGSIRIVAFDIHEQNIRDLQEDRISVILDQDAYTQGYQSAMLLYQYLAHGQKPPHEHMYTEIVIKTKYNL